MLLDPTLDSALTLLALLPVSLLLARVAYGPPE